MSKILEFRTYVSFVKVVPSCLGTDNFDKKSTKIIGIINNIVHPFLQRPIAGFGQQLKRGSTRQIIMTSGGGAQAVRSG